MLIERDLLADGTFDEILKPVRDDFRKSGINEAELDAIVERCTCVLSWTSARSTSMPATSPFCFRSTACVYNVCAVCCCASAASLRAAAASAWTYRLPATLITKSRAPL